MNGSLFLIHSYSLICSLFSPRRDRLYGGRPFGGRGSSVAGLAEKKVLLHCLDVCVGDKCRFPEISFPFPVFLLENVTLTLLTAQNFTGASHFEALGDGRSGF